MLDRRETLHRRPCADDQDGFAGQFPETSPESADLTPFRAAIAQLLTAHHLCPACVVDRHCNIVETNAAAARMLAAHPTDPVLAELVAIAQWALASRRSRRRWVATG